jgi:HD-like signal output (HDOD) protein
MIHLSPTSPACDPAPILKAAASLGVLGSGAGTWPRMLALLCNPKASAGEVSALIDTEPTMYARVLRVANSPYYGQTRSIGTVERALMLLGLDAVRGIAAATCFDRTLTRTGRPSAVDPAALMRHSLATAAAAQALARITHRHLMADAFIAGLMHNLGVVIQAQLDLPGVLAMMAQLRIDPSCDIRALEAQCMHIGHEECIAIIFEAWQLPESLVTAVRHHHAPMSAPEGQRDLAALIGLGTVLALACGNTHTLEPVPPERDTQVMQHLGLTAADLDGLEAELPEKVAALSGALQVA